VDTALFRVIAGHHAPWLDDLMVFASALGRAGFLWLAVAAVAAIYPRHRMRAFRVALAVGLTWLLVDGVLKPFGDRTRPFDAMADVRLIDQRPLSRSFPSGHAAMSAAGALALGRLFPAARAVWWIVAALVAISRVYVGVHWPSDVAAGFVVGCVAGFFVLGGRLGARATRQESLPS
jgi:undecaprenyl-diphosphatase